MPDLVDLLDRYIIWPCIIGLGVMAVIIGHAIWSYYHDPVSRSPLDLRGPRHPRRDPIRRNGETR